MFLYLQSLFLALITFTFFVSLFFALFRGFFGGNSCSFDLPGFLLLYPCLRSSVSVVSLWILLKFYLNIAFLDQFYIYFFGWYILRVFSDIFVDQICCFDFLRRSCFLTGCVSWSFENFGRCARSMKIMTVLSIRLDENNFLIIKYVFSRAVRNLVLLAVDEMSWRTDFFPWMNYVIYCDAYDSLWN